MTLTSSSSGIAAGSAVEPAPDLPSSRRASRVRTVALVIVRKVASALVVLWGAATVAFFAQLALPGDRATVILNIRAGQAQQRTAAELAPINAEYGLQHPVLQQYWDYLRGLVAGDFGTSYQQFRPVAAIIGEQLGATATLSVTAILFAWVLMVVWVTLTAGSARSDLWWMSWPPDCRRIGSESSCCSSSRWACAGSR
jgi:peptide/nickel transport system permease protein